MLYKVGSIEQQKLQASSKGYNKGYLRDQLSYEASINQLLFGANLEYVATHHYGREEDGIVQREVIGIASGPWNDGDEILAILQDHLQAS